ncbi:fructose-6-phosphate aldolase [Salibacterium salarium]|uniref:Fructose-6-phosphate aldolase n=1 Tax=Salibacterium salarium TaxID=284579 RepID=A0A3R9WNC6_9BACI|nr:transaldolase family protein [Salibacterium salarium]RSL30125.1 fructose-6-phosphate aldolase [Salibacterium salarium]
MKLLIDSANIEDIKRLKEIFPVSGVTTNPSILAKERSAPEKILNDVYRELDSQDEFHIQVLSDTAEDMKKEADNLLQTFGRSLYIKVPVSKEGFRAIKWLSSEGINVTATAVFTVQQGILAAMAGASYIAPYINRIETYNGDGTEFVQKLSYWLEQSHFKAEILAASFKNTKQIEDALLSGAYTVTVPPPLVDKMSEHQGTDDGIKGFKNDYESAFN